MQKPVLSAVLNEHWKTFVVIWKALLRVHYLNLQVIDEKLRGELVSESAAMCLLGRLDPDAITVGDKGGTPSGQSVHLVVQVRALPLVVRRLSGTDRRCWSAISANWIWSTAERQ